MYCTHINEFDVTEHVTDEGFLFKLKYIQYGFLCIQYHLLTLTEIIQKCFQYFNNALLQFFNQMWIIPVDTVLWETP